MSFLLQVAVFVAAWLGVKWLIRKFSKGYDEHCRKK